MRVALLVVAAASLLAVPGPAQAHPEPNRAGPHAVALQDRPGDVWTFSDTTTGYEPAVQPAADVLRARVTHGRNGVGVRMVFDDLQRVDTQWYWVDVHTAGKTATFVVEAAAGHWRGIAYQELQGEWVKVAGLTHRIDYSADVMELRIAGRLLGNPPWVRVRLRNELGAGQGVFFTDNPTTATPTPLFTARLPRGEARSAATAAGSSRR